MEIGVGHVNEVAVRSDVGSGREQAKARVFDNRIGACPIFPDGAFRPAVAFGNVEILFVRRNRDSVRPIDIHGHEPGAHLALNARAARAKTNEHNLVRGFANHVNEIILRGMFGSRRRRRLRSAAEAKRHENQQTWHEPTLTRQKTSAFLFSISLRKAARASPAQRSKSISKARNAHQWS